MKNAIFARIICGLTLLYAAITQAEPQSPTIFRTLDTNTPPANIAVSKDGRIFMSTHLAWGSPHKVVELLDDGSHVPYPDYEFYPPLNGVLGAIVDEKGIFWFLDTIWGKDGIGRVIGWDINKNKLYKMFTIARPLVHDAYILNDMAVDRDNNAIYITETADRYTSALLVLDIETGLVRRVLEGSSATVAEDKDLVIDGTTLQMQGNDARIGVNPITIDVKNEWVYFAPMSGETLYRAKTQDLLDESLSTEQLQARVEAYADKPMGDGITMDKAGNIYVSDLANNAIGVITTDREYKILAQDDEVLSWVEGFATAGKHGILATANKLHKSPAFLNQGERPSQFYILRIDPLAKAVIGR